jgi:hypothetical protein
LSSSVSISNKTPEEKKDSLRFFKICFGITYVKTTAIAGKKSKSLAPYLKHIYRYF